MEPDEEWMWVTIRVPPGSRMNTVLPAVFEDLGFEVDIDRIGLKLDDGTFIEYAPGPPPAGA